MKALPPYRFFDTADGSPTLELAYTGDLKEYMHNSKGAFEESVYIYGEALRQAYEALAQPRIISVGLGLGYNELISLSLALSLKMDLSQFFLSSYESELALREYFLNFLSGNLGLVPTDFQEAYTKIISACCLRYNLESSLLKEGLLRLREEGRWQLREEFDPFSLSPSDQWHVFLYDAFSSKMSPQLWSEEGLTHLLKNHALTPGFFATYAAKGTLKRSLKSTHFTMIERSGFSGKRQSTLAIREIRED